MATRVRHILGANTQPDNSGNVWPEPAAINFQSNDRYPMNVFAFADTSTRDKLGGQFQVPADYVTTAVLGLVWGTTTTSGNVRWEFDYTAIADAESLDPSSDQESVASTVAVPGTARLKKVTEINLTSANLVAGDSVEFVIARDGAEAGPLDTAAAVVYLVDAYFKYSDT